MRILHLLIDWVFDNAAIGIFSDMEKDCVLENRFVILRTSDDKVLHKIESRHKVDVIQVNTDAYEWLKKEPFDIIWVHALTDIKARFVLSLPKRPVIVWSTWGYDYVRFANRWLYGLRTTRLWLKGTAFKSAVKSIMTYLVSITPWVRFLPHLYCKFFRVVDFYSTVVPEEEVFLSRILGKKAKRIAFHYCSQKNRDVIWPRVDLSAKRIWIGNSATLTNNHLDVLPVIEECKGFEIHIPLSYSTFPGDKVVSEAVEKEGKRRWGDRFYSHKDFLPFDEYRKLMGQCALFIFAHRRQQSGGNITLALRMGGCVVMDERNPIFQYAKRNGICLYSLSDLKRHGAERLIEDFRPRQLENMTKARELWRYERMMTEIRNSIGFLREKIEGNQVTDTPVAPQPST